MNPSDLEHARPQQHRAAADAVDPRHVDRADRERRGQEPDRLQRVVRALGRVADGLEDVREEEPVGAGDEVPDAVHHDQEASARVARNSERNAPAAWPGLLLRLRPQLRLDHPLPQRPGDQRDDEQLREQHAATTRRGPRNAMPDDQRRDRAHVPEHLRQPGQPPADFAGAVSVISVHDAGHVGADRQADDEVAEQQHPRRLREHDPQRAERVQQQVVLVDLLAPPQVADAPADQRADAGRDRVRAHRPQQRHEVVAEPELLGPDRQRHRARDDRARRRCSSPSPPARSCATAPLRPRMPFARIRPNRPLPTWRVAAVDLADAVRPLHDQAPDGGAEMKVLLTFYGEETTAPARSPEEIAATYRRVGRVRRGRGRGGRADGLRGARGRHAATTIRSRAAGAG